MSEDKGCTELQTDEAVSPVKQDLKDLEDGLGTLSDNINLCDQVLDDLRDLRGVLERKSLQYVSLQPQK